MSVGERIKEVRREKGLTQEKFAERIGLRQNTIALIESGRRNTSRQTLQVISREYGLNIEWLKTGTGAKYAEIDNVFESLQKRYDLTPEEVTLLKKHLSLPREVRVMPLQWLLRLTAKESDAETQSGKNKKP